MWPTVAQYLRYDRPSGFPLHLEYSTSLGRPPLSGKLGMIADLDEDYKRRTVRKDMASNK
jgi:hypothetical protein